MRAYAFMSPARLVYTKQVGRISDNPYFKPWAGNLARLHCQFSPLEPNKTHSADLEFYNQRFSLRFGIFTIYEVSYVTYASNHGFFSWF